MTWRMPKLIGEVVRTLATAGVKTFPDSETFMLPAPMSGALSVPAPVDVKLTAIGPMKVPAVAVLSATFNVLLSVP